MVEAAIKEEDRQIEAAYWRTAWQTAFLMNATGNYRQRIKPEKLIGNMFEQKSSQKPTKPKNRAEAKQELQRVKERFHVSDQEGGS